jgi:hypothetical protein
MPVWLLPLSFRVTGITGLFSRDVLLDGVQFLAGYSSPQTTGLYERR